MDIAPAVSAVELSPAEPVVTIATMQESPSGSDKDIIGHVEFLFQYFLYVIESWV